MSMGSVSTMVFRVYVLEVPEIFFCSYCPMLKIGKLVYHTRWGCLVCLGVVVLVLSKFGNCELM